MQAKTQPFGQLLRSQIERAGISIRELGRRLNIAPIQLHRLLTGENEPGAGRLFAIARALGVDVSVFEPAFRGDDTRKGEMT